MTSKTKFPKVSIILASYNSERWIDQCFTSLLAQNYKNIEVIFVDNNSKDKSVKIAKLPKYKKLNIIFAHHDHNVGFSVANNTGYDHSKGEILFLLNPDARIEPDTIVDAVEYFEMNPKVGIVQNKIVVMEEPSKIDSIGSMMTDTGFLFHLRIQDIDEKTKGYPVFSAKGASMFVKRKLVERSYLFNGEYHSYFEDTDLCWRAWLLGYDVMYSAKIAKTYHHGGGTAIKLGSELSDYNSFKNRILTLFTHYGTVRLIFIMPFHLACCLLVAIIYTLIGRWRNTKSILRAIIWNIKRLPVSLKDRKVLQSTRKRSDKEIFSQVHGNLKFDFIFKSLMSYTTRK